METSSETSPLESDSELISAAVAGDVAAYGRLVARYQRDAVRIAAVALGSAADADDVAQDAFIKIHNALPRFDLTAPFRSWLYRIVVNTARSRQRSGSRRSDLRLQVARAVSTAPRPDDDPADSAVRADRSQQIVAAMNQLRPDDRLILSYRWFDQLSEAEMAGALDCPVGTVKSRLSRATQRLRTELAEHHLHPERSER